MPNNPLWSVVLRPFPSRSAVVEHARQLLLERIVDLLVTQREGVSAAHGDGGVLPERKVC